MLPGNRRATRSLVARQSVQDIYSSLKLTAEKVEQIMNILNKKFNDIKLNVGEGKSVQEENTDDLRVKKTSHSVSFDSPECSENKVETVDSGVALAVAMIEAQMERDIESKLHQVRFNPEKILKPLQSRDIDQLFTMAVEKTEEFREIEKLYRLVHIQEPVHIKITTKHSSII